MTEIWKDIEGFEGYQVSNIGRVRSLDRDILIQTPQGTIYKSRKKGHILTPSKDKDGYLQVGLYHSKHGKIHRLVATAFIENPNGYKCVNHKDENKQNNRVDNLEWCTKTYNNLYGTHIERSAKGHRKQIEQLSLNGEHINTYESLIAAEKDLGINGASTMISRCCKNIKKTAYGYKWRYKAN